MVLIPLDIYILAFVDGLYPFYSGITVAFIMCSGQFPLLDSASLQPFTYAFLGMLLASLER